MQHLLGKYDWFYKRIPFCSEFKIKSISYKVRKWDEFRRTLVCTQHATPSAESRGSKSPLQSGYVIGPLQNHGQGIQVALIWPERESRELCLLVGDGTVSQVVPALRGGPTPNGEVLHSRIPPLTGCSRRPGHIIKTQEPMNY